MKMKLQGKLNLMQKLLNSTHCIFHNTYFHEFFEDACINFLTLTWHSPNGHVFSVQPCELHGIPLQIIRYINVWLSGDKVFQRMVMLNQSNSDELWFSESCPCKKERFRHRQEEDHVKEDTGDVCKPGRKAAKKPAGPESGCWVSSL